MKPSLLNYVLAMTILFYDPLFQRHHTGRHPENSARLQAIQDRINQSGLARQCVQGEYQSLALKDIQEVHAPEVIARIQALAEVGGGWLDADTFMSADSCQVTLAATGACVAGVEHVLRGDDRSALCLIRPPGHHATRCQSMGFCLFNNIALAAKHARNQLSVERILIVDWDVHHGNGTQDIFWTDPTVHFLSIHRFGHGFYPGTGNVMETGSGAGQGYTTNIPVRFGTSRRDYLAMFRNSIETAADKIKPDLVLISAGFDAHLRDPIGSLGLETEDFAEMTRVVLTVAATHAKGRIVSCLEGGYHLEALSESVEIHLQELLHPP